MPHASLPANSPRGAAHSSAGARPPAGGPSLYNPPASPTHDRIARRALDTAAEQLGQGRFDEATRVLGQVLRQWPDCADAMNLLGVAAYGRGDEEAAVGHFARALSVNDRLVGAHANLGLALLNQGRMREGAGALARALEIDPAHGAAICGMAAVLLRSGALRQAEALYRRALTIAPLLFHAEAAGEAADETSWPDRLIDAVSRLPAPVHGHRGEDAP